MRILLCMVLSALLYETSIGDKQTSLPLDFQKLQITHFGRVRVVAKSANYPRPFRPSFRLFTCISAGPSGRIPSHFILDTFTTICRENSNLVEIEEKYRTLYRRTKYVLL
jgi:hypothetical protein